MKIDLIQYSPLYIARDAALVCTGYLDKKEEKDTEAFLKGLLKQGHLSVFEHLFYTFHVQDVSRALLQELARHRHISLSVQSTRWCLHKTANDTNKAQSLLSEVYCNAASVMKSEEQVSAINDAFLYSTLLQGCIKQMIRTGVPNDVVKYFVQEATLTSLYLTVNARALKWIHELRSQKNVLPEFRKLVWSLINRVPVDHLFIYKMV